VEDALVPHRHRDEWIFVKPLHPSILKHGTYDTEDLGFPVWGQEALGIFEADTTRPEDRKDMLVPSCAPKVEQTFGEHNQD